MGKLGGIFVTVPSMVRIGCDPVVSLGDVRKIRIKKTLRLVKNVVLLFIPLRIAIIIL
ncbi:MAG: hypothetical protein SCALA701_26470 [Candidatus Scalindua sp.]|nr:MAG: hypothetical protein SCALA701_26470 [Candidatus Scalindua sp.]